MNAVHIEDQAAATGDRTSQYRRPGCFEVLATRALCTMRAGVPSERPPDRSEAAKERLYGRMFPSSAGQGDATTA